MSAFVNSLCEELQEIAESHVNNDDGKVIASDIVNAVKKSHIISQIKDRMKQQELIPYEIAVDYTRLSVVDKSECLSGNSMSVENLGSLRIYTAFTGIESRAYYMLLMAVKFNRDKDDDDAITYRLYCSADGNDVTVETHQLH